MGCFLASSLVTVQIGIQYGKAYFVWNRGQEKMEKDEAVSVKRKEWGTEWIEGEEQREKSGEI